ncbi:LysM peptidoglycan-binding domain-containing protein [Desulfolucanica intricata]|uniref:LysM peptidoglycan-binding domain-containing protein n=1 Tax=Desulfolucanica intricata TaxID=1285191 RepID=UPI00082F6731|nr:LysM peptidoglycan-binding domain-containing protein [Desulfolucanica intricata]
MNGQSYTVKPGDSMWSIASRFNISLSNLKKANPQIQNPDNLSPGDIINIPGSSTSTGIKLPCCAVLNRTGSAPVDALGSALVRKLQELRPGRTAITIAANGLAKPQELGNFNAYQGVAFIPGLITWQWVLESTSETFPTWSGTFTEITAELTSNTVIQVRPINTQVENRGEPILTGTLAECRFTA